MSKTDETELDLGLSEAERAELDEAAREEAAEATEAAAAEAKPEGEGDKPAADAKPEPEKPADAAADADPKTAAEAKPAEAPKPADTPAADPKPVVEAKPVPRPALPDWQAPEDADAKLKELADKRDTLAERFDAGEISAKDLFKEQSALDAQTREIERAIDRADMAAEQAKAVWFKSAVPSFLDANPHYRDNPTLNAMLDAEVRRLQTAATAEGRDQLDPAILAQADKTIKESLASFGVAAPAAAKPDAKPAAEEKPAPRPASAKPNIPPTLANIPASDIDAGIDNSKFATLDRLLNTDPLAYERAVSTLSPAEQEAYGAYQH